MHHPQAARGGQELVTEAQQPTRRNQVGQVGGAIAAFDHVDHLAAAAPQHLNYHPDHVGVDFNVHFLERFQHFAIIAILQDHFRARDLELIALAAHGLNQDGQVQLTAARDQERIRGFGLGHAQRYVGAQLVEQALAQLAGGAPLALAPREGGVVDREGHAHCGLIDGDGRQWDRVFGVGQGLANGDALQPSQRNDLAGLGVVDFDLFQPLVDVQVASALAT